MTTSLFAQIENNYFESAQGEAETISDKTFDNVVRGNTFKDITKGWVTARLGGARRVREQHVHQRARHPRRQQR
jgi:hypothetical protein